MFARLLRQARPAPRSRPRSTRLEVEALEGRSVPSAVTALVGSASGFELSSPPGGSHVRELEPLGGSTITIIVVPRGTAPGLLSESVSLNGLLPVTVEPNTGGPPTNTGSGNGLLGGSTISIIVPQNTKSAPGLLSESVSLNGMFLGDPALTNVDIKPATAPCNLGVSPSKASPILFLHSSSVDGIALNEGTQMESRRFQTLGSQIGDRPTGTGDGNRQLAPTRDVTSLDIILGPPPLPNHLPHGDLTLNGSQIPVKPPGEGISPQEGKASPILFLHSPGAG